MSLVRPDSAPGVLDRAPAVLVAITLALAGLSLVMVYSTAGVLAKRYGSSTLLLHRQMMWIAIGAAALWFMARTDHQRLRACSGWILLGALALLIAVLIPGIGTRFNGARRWIRFFGVGFQPSDPAKLATIIFIADRLAANQDRIGDFKRGFLPFAAVTGLVVVLIALEPDLGTSLLIGGVLFAMILAAGIRWEHVLPVGLLVAAGASILVAVRFDHVMLRLQAWWDPEGTMMGKGWQVYQSLVALGAGGLGGVGLGASTQKLFFLPESHTDFILAIVGEELGLIGTGAVALLFLAFIFQGVKIVNLTRDLYAVLLALGLTLAIGLQAVINIAVVTVAVPTKGISLPLVSFGGSNTVVSMAAIGILINIARTTARVQPVDEAEAASAVGRSPVHDSERDEDPGRIPMAESFGPEPVETLS